MKKLYTYLSSGILFLISITSSAQVLIPENFEGTSAAAPMPQGWLFTSSPPFASTMAAPCEGARSVRVVISANNQNATLRSPVQTATGDDIEISFLYKIIDDISGAATPTTFGSLQLQYSLNPNTATPFWTTYEVIDATNHIPSANCATSTVTIAGASVPAGSDFAWRMRTNWASGNYYVYVDDFLAVEQVDCIEPFYLSIDNITIDQAQISWVDKNGATQWEVEYGPVGFPLGFSPSFGTVVITNVDTATLTGLDDETEYDVYIRAICGSGDQSNWAGPLTFQTLAFGTYCTIAFEINNDPLNPVAGDLPFTHSSNTSNYGNNYSGMPGSFCNANGDFLYGNDVVYKYIPDDDYILTVELSGLSEDYSGVFIYGSCGDIGNVCFAPGSTNETSGDHSFQVFVEDGKDYYIVVSSKNPTITMDYTITINGTSCANSPHPVGSATQTFFDGQTLADLDVTGPNLIWYSDAAATIVIPDSVLLVDNTKYYVTQTFQGCESSALDVTVLEVSCNVLGIVASSGASVCGNGSVKLMTQGFKAVNNTNIYWYDSAIGGTRVGMGNQYETHPLNETTSFWASEFAFSEKVLTGQAFANPSAMDGSQNNNGLIFNITNTITLIDVLVWSTTLQGGEINIELRNIDYGNKAIANKTITIPGANPSYVPVPYRVALDFEIPPGNYRLLKTSGPGMGRVKAVNTNFPYNIGNSGQVISGSTSTGGLSLYYYFFDWTILEKTVLCESPRHEVIATINEVADEMVTAPMPYVHSANTSFYGNNYSGAAGWDCGGTGDLLDGYDVVYQFSPTVGGVYSVYLSNLSSDNAAVLVYESCFDIGNGCYAGAISGGTTANFGIDEVAMYDGIDYFIVISTSDSPTTSYTLTIDTATINCADYTATPGGDENQFFEDGKTLADLDVKGGNLTWYSNASGTTPIPNTTVMVDGATYYVRQTLNGCPSGLLSVTVTEIYCDDLKILSTTGGTIVCKGAVTLQGVGNGGFGTEIYWYSSASGGFPIAYGDTFTTPELLSTTSYWVSEVFLDGDLPLLGQGKPVPTSNSRSTSIHGLRFDVFQDFILKSVDVYTHPAGSGSLEISLYDNTGIRLKSFKMNVAPGGGPITVPLNFYMKPGSGYRLLPTSFPNFGLIRDITGNNFPYEIGMGGALGSITNGAYGTSNTSAFYSYFYNWTVGGQEICESEREEVIAVVSQDGNIIVPSTLPYVDYNKNTFTFGNTFTGAPGSGCGTTENYLNGYEVVYMFTPTKSEYIELILSDLSDYNTGLFVYESCSDINNTCLAGVVAQQHSNDLSIKEFFVTANKTYYIVVSSLLTSGIGYTLEIKAFVCADFPSPVGDSPQDFILGKTLADLKVEGTTPSSILVWFSDAVGHNLIPESTPLVDKATYYVRQNFNNCDSPLLAITVNQSKLGVEDIVFADLQYYPNPVDGVLIITNNHPIDAVDVYSMLGQKISHQKVGLAATTVDLTGLASGVYLLKVLINDKVGIYTVVIK